MTANVPTFSQLVLQARERLNSVLLPTRLELHAGLSARYQCSVYLKREDQQLVRSYKIRGAYNMISSLPADILSKGVVCASAGNHAQGVAYSCNALKVKGTIFMPVITPQQKIRQTRMFGGDFVDIRLTGDTFDDCAAAARAFTEAHQQTFIPPFDDLRIITGQATIGAEILETLPAPDCVIVPIGGGGLCAGAGSYIKEHVPEVQILGAEPEGAPSMYEALKAGAPVTLDQIDRFVDGAAVKRVGDLTFSMCRKILTEVIKVPEGKVCSTILEMYDTSAIVLEPAGALAIAALDSVQEQIRGKQVVCVIGGGNNDIDRMQEIKERSLQYEGLKHYFLIRFAQRPGALKEFVSHVLGATDDIVRFEYMQKHNKETGPALVGVELQRKEDYQQLLQNMRTYQVNFTELNKDDSLFSYIV